MELRKLLEKNTVIKQRNLSDTISKTKIKDFINDFAPKNKMIKGKKNILLKMYQDFVRTLEVDHTSEILPKTLDLTKMSVIKVSSLIDNIDNQVEKNKISIAHLQDDIDDYRKLQQLANYVRKIGKSIFE